MNRTLLIGTAIVSATIGILIGRSVSVESPGSIAGAAPTAPEGGPQFGTGLPAPGQREWYTAQVLLVSDALAEPVAIFVARGTYNRLRDEAGATPECDGPGLQFVVTAGPAAAQWGIPVGSEVELVQLLSTVGVPESIVVGDDWFGTGQRVLSLPDGCAQ